MANLDDAQKELGLNPQERALYERHLSNLTGSGGADNSDGTRSTLLAVNVEQDGKIYNLPTVWGGKELDWDDPAQRKQIIANVDDAGGLGAFPSYPDRKTAQDRYQAMHDYMEKDTADYQEKKGADDFDARSLFPNSDMNP